MRERRDRGKLHIGRTASRAGEKPRTVRDDAHPLLRGVRCEATDGRTYTVLANFAAEAASLTIDGRAVTIPAGAGEILL